MEKQLAIFEKYGINYHTMSIKLEHDGNGYVRDKYNHFKKIFINPPDVKEPCTNGCPEGKCKCIRKWVKVENCKNPLDNAFVVHFGRFYDLIGIDVDDKEKTMEGWRNETKNININTLTSKTINGGEHLYFTLSSEQKEQLGDFCTKNDAIYADKGLKIDVKYNTQRFIEGFSQTIEGTKYRYKVINDVKPIQLPSELFDEIMKNIKPKEEKIKQAKKSRENILTQQPKECSEKTLNEAIKLTELLSDERATEYEPWINTCWALHNISEKLLPSFIDFSKRCMNKFNENHCVSSWNSSKDTGFGIGSLHYWAKIDNEEAYNAYVEEKTMAKLIKNIDKTHLGIAKVIKKMVKNHLVCSEIVNKSKIWYMFNKGTWNRLQDDSMIRRFITSRVIKMYRKASIYLNAQNNKDEMNSVDAKNNDNKNKVLMSIIEKLSTDNFVNGVINVLANELKDDEFSQKLDANSNLLCFGEDVYDCETCSWRETLPNDYCSLKMGVNKEQINKENAELVEKIIGDIFPAQDKYEYAMNRLATFIHGKNADQIFSLWRGAGANGKSLLAMWLRYAFGDYFALLNSTLITEKQKSSGNPELLKAKGRRICVLSEPEQTEKIRNSTLKSWTGGDLITARMLYSNQIVEFNGDFHIIILCNMTTQLEDVVDDSMPRRTDYLQFTSKFVDIPKADFQKKLNKTYMNNEFVEKIKGSFFYLLLNRYEQLKKNNALTLRIPEIVKNEKKNFIDDCDIVKAFLNENYEPSNEPTAYVSAKDLFAHFKEYCKINGQSNKIKEITFKQRCEGIYTLQARYTFYVMENGKKKRKEVRSAFVSIKAKDGEEQQINEDILLIPTEKPIENPIESIEEEPKAKVDDRFSTIKV